MKNAVWLARIAACVIAVSGCSSTPEVVEDAPLTLEGRFRLQAEQILAAGGLAAVGVDASQSLDLAMRRAKAYGRRELSLLLEAKIETLRIDFAAETGLNKKDPMLVRFAAAAEDITDGQIRDLVADELKYETTNGLVTACALMELDPRLILDQLTEDKELSESLQNTRTLEMFKSDITGYEAFKAGLTLPTAE